jgi:NitT/TauT family transport system substrate-binding protein
MSVLRLVRLIAVVALSLLATACGLGAPQGSAPASKDSGKPETTSVKIGTAVPSAAFTATFVAIEKGIFKKYGLDVQVQPFEGGPRAVQALIADEVQVFEGDFPPILSTYGKDDELVVFSQTHSWPNYQFFGKKGIDSWQKMVDANGVVGVSAIGGIDYIVARYALTKAGFKADSVRYTAAGAPAERSRALIAGRVDMVAAAPPGSYLLEKEGMPKIGQLGDVLSGLPLEQYATTRKFYGANPNTLKVMVTAQREASEWVRQNKDAATDTLMTTLKIDPAQREDWRRTMDEYGPHFGPSEVSRDGYRLLTQFYVEEGRIKDDPETVLGKMLTFWK